MKQNSKWNLLILALIIIAGVASSIIFHRNTAYIIKLLFHVIKHALSHNFFVAYLFMLLITMPQYLFFMPGLRVIIMITGFLLKNFFYAYALIFLTKTTWTMITYFVFGLVKESLYDKFKNELIFKVLRTKIKTEPLRVCFMMRLLIFVPISHINFILRFLEVDIYTYFISFFFTQLPNITLMLLLVEGITNINSFYKGLFNINNTRVNTIMTVSLIFLFIAILIFIYLSYENYQEYQRLKKQYLSENLHDIENNSKSKSKQVSGADSGVREEKTDKKD